MVKVLLPLVSVAVAALSCEPLIAANTGRLSMRDARSYAVAACLSQQSNAYLRDQGFRWAEVVVQGRDGELQVLKPIAVAVRAAASKQPMIVVSDENSPTRSKDLPVAYCDELADTPQVSAAIRKAGSPGPSRARR